VSTVQEERIFADRLIDLIERTFFHAYFARAHGVPETALLIDYDIEAAYLGVDAEIVDTCRKTIKSAVAAVEQKVAFAPARAYLLSQVQAKVAELIAPGRKHPVINYICSHYQCPWCGDIVPGNAPLHDCQCTAPGEGGTHAVD
jgi:hypothetical protein